MTSLFITGTDTEIGKTHVAAHLLGAGAAAGWRCAGYKPVAAGAEQTPAGWRNDDALALQAASNVELDYDLINPYCLPPPIAPHVAASEAGVIVDRAHLDHCHDVIAQQCDWLLVEGAGGWRVPLGPDWDYADWVSARGWPVLLVVGMRLGCINHALLTAESIARRGQLLGWVANCLPPAQPRLAENIQSLVERMPAPLLGIFPADGQKAADLQLDKLR
ncbi:MAG: dethiobiotin synthase [Nevskiales bacterium]